MMKMMKKKKKKKEEEEEEEGRNDQTNVQRAQESSLGFPLFLLRTSACCTTGYAVGCVTEERQKQTRKIRTEIEDNLELLQQTRKSSYVWRRELKMRQTKDATTM
ncbi:hypothetical protein ElyMa_006439800, partial [Elysia marginata]